MNPAATPGRGATRVLLVEAGAALLALPLARVRRVVGALPVHALPAAAPALLGLAEFSGEAIPVFDLGRLAGGGHLGRQAAPTTVVAWTGPEGARELVGLAVDAAVEIAELATDGPPPSAPGAAPRDVEVAGRAVRYFTLEALENLHATNA